MSRIADLSPLSQLLERIDARTDGKAAGDALSTGFPSVGRIRGGGLRRGELTVLGGDVGSGKSALALAVTLRAAAAGTRTAYFTTEMPLEQVHERVLAIEGRARI